MNAIVCLSIVGGVAGMILARIIIGRRKSKNVGRKEEPNLPKTQT